ncbi:MAG: hypothetical protein MR531_07415 [Lachnospiraceae bacterium]|nr:hypothetical protein [Lachnospiraceae bacterium]
MNEISRNACSANEAKSIIFSVIEAISSVLLKLAFQYHFQGEVIIYTDNMVAKDIWYRNESALYLASLFQSVKVCHIPRAENKIADGIGRDHVFINIPTRLLDEVVRKCEAYDDTCEILDFIKEYFPNPNKNTTKTLHNMRTVILEELKNTSAMLKRERNRDV